MGIQLDIIMNWIQAIGLLLGSIVAIIWGKQFVDAKNAVIEAKDAVIEAKGAEVRVLERQIEELKSLNPVTVREYYEATRSSLEEYVENLKGKLQQSRAEVEVKQQQVAKLENDIENMRHDLASSKAQEVTTLGTEIAHKEEVLLSQQAELRELRDRNQALEKYLQQVQESDEKFGVFGNLVTEFDRFYTGFREAAEAENFESMGAIHEHFREDLQMLDLLSVYALELETAMIDFTPQYRDFIDEFRARVQEAGEQGLSMDKLSSYMGNRFALIRRLMWRHFGARQELEQGNLIKVTAE